MVLIHFFLLHLFIALKVGLKSAGVILDYTTDRKPR